MIRENRVYREGSDKTAPPGDPFQAVGPRHAQINVHGGSVPPVMAKFEEACASAACIDEMLGRLGSRLERFMRPMTLVDSAKMPEPPPAQHCAHYDAVDALNSHLQDLNTRLVTILDRLEI